MGEQRADVTTRQKLILEELENCLEEKSGQQLHRTLTEANFNIGLTTVYRHLRALQQKGLVRCRNLPTGEALYSLVNRDQHHLTCVDCGKTFVLNTCPIKNIDLSNAQKRNFQLLFHTLEFFGFCENCQQLHKVK